MLETSDAAESTDALAWLAADLTLALTPLATAVPSFETDEAVLLASDAAE